MNKKSITASILRSRWSFRNHCDPQLNHLACRKSHGSVWAARLQNSFIRANQSIEFPSSDAPFQFRVSDPGTETVIAVCNATSRTIDLIGHDFGTAAFTNLGDYEKFATRAIVIEAAERKSQADQKGESGSNIASRTGSVK
jgi:hypothetical protein